MATPRQIEANRRNAQKSTGPRTPEGKAAVRLNSLQHGLRARTVVLPGDDPQEFQQLCDDLESEWQPQTRTEQIYLEQMAIAYWKLQRMELLEARTISGGLSDLAPIMLERLWQAQQRLERSFASAQRELERIQISHNRQVQQPEEPSLPANPTAAVGQAVLPASAFSKVAQYPHPITATSPSMEDRTKSGIISV